jgi:hypothetical protein
MKQPRRKCTNKSCRQWFYPVRNGQVVCCFECASAVRKKQAEKARETARAKTEARQRKTSETKPLHSLQHWIELTERAVNNICRETALANGEGCISCGTLRALVWHAGHYRTTAAAGHLRFNRININLQCDECNVQKSGNIKAYRAGLVEKYGEPAVLELENDNTPHRWTEDELEKIRFAALADMRAMKKQVAA